MISLRRAKLDDHWRITYKRNYPIILNELSLIGGEIFQEVKLELRSGVNAIVGKNGTGKSNFMRTIFNCLATDNSNRKRFAKLLDSSQLYMNATINDVNHTVSLSPFGIEMGQAGILCLLFDPCNLIPEIQRLFHEQDNIEELLESFSSVSLEDDDLKLVNFLTNTSYEKVEVINIEDEYESFPMLPFFIVEKDQSKYDSRNMGLGELSLLYFYWLFDYIKKSDEHCLLLVEEPESFLPPLIQDRFCDVIAMTSATNGSACILSTHSEHILKKIPRTHIHIMGAINRQLKFLTASSHFEQMSVLGLTAPKKGILFFEDQAARLFIKALVKASPLFVVDSFYYHQSGSDSDIIVDLGRLPTNLKDFAFVAVFDGDCQGKYDTELREFSNYIFLPTMNAPEEVLISYVQQLELSVISDFIGVSTEALSAAKEVAAGSDHHDYFVDISRVLGVNYETIFSKLSELWIADDTNKDSVNEFFQALDSKVG